MVMRHDVAISLAALGALFFSVADRLSANGAPPTKRGANAKLAPASTGDAGDSASSEASGTPTEFVIHRRRIHLRAPEKYQVSMHLDPVRSVRLAAPFDGTVRSLVHKPGEKVESGTEVVRMDTTEKQFRLDRAKALYKVAQIEEGLAGTSLGTPKELAAARLQAAKADLDLAVYWVEQGVVRAPFNGEVLRIDVSEGQTVRMADPLGTVGDTTAMTVEVPVDRNSTKAGQPMDIKVEDRSMPATVDVILPLAARFEALRDLVPSAASAMLIVPNTDGKLRVGQTVYSPLIPRDFVADVPNSCIANTPDGNHKVQVLRNSVVRDIPIAALAPVGPDRSFVSGAFDPADEVIESATPELADGTVVRAAPPAPQPLAAAKSANPAARNRGPRGETPAETPAETTPAKSSGL